MTLFSEKMLISTGCTCGFMPNVRKKSWMVPIIHLSMTINDKNFFLFQVSHRLTTCFHQFVIYKSMNSFHNIYIFNFWVHCTREICQLTSKCTTNFEYSNLSNKQGGLLINQKILSSPLFVYWLLTFLPTSSLKWVKICIDFYHLWKYVMGLTHTAGSNTILIQIRGVKKSSFFPN